MVLVIIILIVVVVVVVAVMVVLVVTAAVPKDRFSVYGGVLFVLGPQEST